MDVAQQIQYWKEMAEYDIDTAALLVQEKRLLPGLFFCHLTIEKILKAPVVKSTSAHPPRTHSLTLLLTKSNLKLSVVDFALLGDLMVYQMEGRYPTLNVPEPDPTETEELLEKTKSLLEWLRKRL